MPTITLSGDDVKVNSLPTATLLLPNKVPTSEAITLKLIPSEGICIEKCHAVSDVGEAEFDVGSFICGVTYSSF